MMKTKFIKILIICFNIFLLFISIKVVYNFILEKNHIVNNETIDCFVISKDCKYSRATSHCNVRYNDKEYRVSIVDCDNLKIGKNNINFYYDSFFDEIIFKGYIHIKYVVLIPLMFFIVLFFSLKAPAGASKTNTHR